MKFMELLDRPIAFQRSFVTITGSVTAALMLSQACYWTQRTSADGWFFKTQVEWEDETGLTRREQETARATLRKLGLLEEQKRGVPAKIYYRPVESMLRDLCKAADKQGWRKAPNCDGGKRQPITETTQRLPTAKGAASKADDERETVRRVFAHYLEVTGRNGKLYSLTPARMDKGLSRLQDALAKTGGDMKAAEELLTIAVDALGASEWHQGANDKGKAFNDWTDHLFKSTDKFEKWLEQ